MESFFAFWGELYCKKIEEPNQNFWIENQECVPDGILQINNEQLDIPYFNYKNQPEKLPEKIEFEKINSINWHAVKNPEKGSVTAQPTKISRTFKVIKINSHRIKRNVNNNKYYNKIPESIFASKWIIALNKFDGIWNHTQCIKNHNLKITQTLRKTQRVLIGRNK